MGLYIPSQHHMFSIVHHLARTWVSYVMMVRAIFQNDEPQHHVLANMGEHTTYTHMHCHMYGGTTHICTCPQIQQRPMHWVPSLASVPHVPRHCHIHDICMIVCSRVQQLTSHTAML